MKEITELLLKNAIKPSSPRLHIYGYLANFKNHPTVEDIHTYVIDIIPTLSKTTVYNTLNLFEEEHLVKSLYLNDSEKHYELIIEKHSHFQCELCNNIFDIPYDEKDLLPSGYENFKIKKTDIFLKGLCADCK